MRRFARAAGIGAIVVDAAGGARWRALLEPTLTGVSRGGVTLYPLGQLTAAARAAGC